jgi:hypothetical protein
MPSALRSSESQLGVHRRRRGEPDGLSDLANRGWVATLSHGPLDEIEDALLP